MKPWPIVTKTLFFESKSQEELITRVVARLGGAAVDFERTKEVLSDEIHIYLGLEGVRFDKTHGTKQAPAMDITKEYIDSQMLFGPENTPSHQQYAEALLGYCTPNLFDVSERSPFDSINQPTQEKKEEVLSILTQLFLAELNSVYRAKELTKANFGVILESSDELRLQLVEEVKKALIDGASVEAYLITWLQNHAQEFQISTALTEEDRAIVISRFKVHYQTIKDSPHFDEFLFLSEKAGPFVTRGGFIATHFAQFVQAGFFREA